MKKKLLIFYSIWCDEKQLPSENQNEDQDVMENEETLRKIAIIPRMVAASDNLNNTQADKIIAIILHVMEKVVQKSQKEKKQDEKLPIEHMEDALSKFI